MEEDDEWDRRFFSLCIISQHFINHIQKEAMIDQSSVEKTVDQYKLVIAKTKKLFQESKANLLHMLFILSEF